MRLSSNGIVHKAALWSDKLLPSPCSQHGRFFLQGRQAGKQKYVRICSPPLGQQDSYHYVLHIKQVQSRILLARSSLALWDNYSWMKCLPSLSAVSFHLQQIVWWSSTFPASDTSPVILGCDEMRTLWSHLVIIFHISSGMSWVPDQWKKPAVVEKLLLHFLKRTSCSVV